MQKWDKNSNDVSKITPDKEKANALLLMVELRERDIKTKSKEFVTLIVEGYYEIIKELITAIMSIDGYKTVSHELLIGYLAEFYKEFNYNEIYVMDQLRRTRNDIAYRGVKIPLDYLERNKKQIIEIIDKLKLIIKNKL